MRKQIAAANWKMNLTLEGAEKLIDEILATEHSVEKDQLAVFAVPFPYIIPVQNKLAGKPNVFIAAQNCSAKKAGAFTGEVSAEMLNSLGVKYVVIGHSERREYYFESNSLLAEKITRACEYDIHPIFCCGEPLNIREAGTQNNYVEVQLKESISHMDRGQAERLIIAYEPIWAIGTGKTATSEQAQEMHAHIRKVIAELFDNTIAENISILYGGSVKASNAKDIFGKPDVDGGLVGGASLNAIEFAAIINSLKK